ncbi:MAG: hypothetical protein DMG09_06290 [Acidobacteria bacterium]|nr:MAG: hypothetical protein DMG09_06290 [Acidobacteriota bacterium]
MQRRLPAGKGPVDAKGVVEAHMPARRRRYDFFLTTSVSAVRFFLVAAWLLYVHLRFPAALAA